MTIIDGFLINEDLETQAVLGNISKQGHAFSHHLDSLGPLRWRGHGFRAPRMINLQDTWRYAVSQGWADLWGMWEAKGRQSWKTEGRFLRHPGKTMVTNKGGLQERPSLKYACAILSPHLFTPRTGPEVTDSMSRVWLLGSVPGLLARQLAYQLCDLWQVTQFPSCERDMAVVSGHRVVCTESITTCRRF